MKKNFTALLVLAMLFSFLSIAIAQEPVCDNGDDFDWGDFRGPKGEKGDDGYTPRRGIDYFDARCENDDPTILLSIGTKAYLNEKWYFGAEGGADVGNSEGAVPYIKMGLTYELGKNPRDVKIEKLQKRLKKLEALIR